MNAHYNHWRDVPMTSWSWTNFSPAEMADRRSGQVFIVPDFMDLLQRLRSTLGFPLIINSAYRTLDHDRAIGGANVHPSGEAVDIGIWGERAYDLVRIASGFGFTGIGIKQHGSYKGRFVHLDTINDDDHPRRWIWSYK